MVEACKRELATQPRVDKPLMTFSSEEDLNQWIRLDDVIMGGNSSSSWKLSEEGYAGESSHESISGPISGRSVLPGQAPLSQKLDCWGGP